MFKTKTFAAATAAIMTFAGAASATTVNFGNADCVENCGSVVSGTTGAGVDFVSNLSVGTKYVVESSGFSGVPSFNALVEVIALSPTLGNASSINISAIPTNNDWMHLRYSFVDGSGKAVKLTGGTSIRVTDVDSNAGQPNKNTQNFTEVVGVNKAVDFAATGITLESGGFIAGGPAVDSSFNFLRQKQINGSWQTVGNVKDFPGQSSDFAAVFNGGSDLTSFDLIWGATGATSKNRVRGFEVLIDNVGGVNVIPVPASLPLLLAGIGGLAFLRRKTRG